MKLIRKRLLFHFLALIYRRSYLMIFRGMPNMLPKIKHPHIVEVELTNDCNFYCSHCHRSKMNRNIGIMEFKVFTKLIDEIASYPTSFLRIVGQGESSLHPDFSEMMHYASNKSIKIEIATNGTLFELFSLEDIISWDIDIIGVSVDGFDKETYQKIRIGGDYDKLRANVSAFLKIRETLGKKYPILCIRNVIFPNTTHDQIAVFKKRWTGKVDYITFNTLILFNNTSNSYSFNYNFICKEIFFDAHIRYDGSVLLCPQKFLYDTDDVIGNIKKESLQKIWTSKCLSEIRDVHFKQEFPESCKSCLNNVSIKTINANSRKYNYSSNRLINCLNKIINLS